ncbi:MAG TPA: ABC transporter permease subunit [Xanthobacteraceae bacterium]|jgi:general L-amino acid transport system permease protein|nr:ABC transporter permease subunit [Xanthobacteraceae bacterium]
MADTAPPPSRHARRFGSIALQAALIVVVGGLAYAAVRNAAQNLADAHIVSGFAFWNNTAGFDISQTLIDYSPSTSTFGRAFWVGLLNTLLVAALGIVLATILGFIVGIAQLSRNWLVSHLAAGYVGLIRNVPLLLQLLFWYNSVLVSLPQLRGSVALPGGGILNNRGLFLPRPQIGSGFGYVVAAFVFSLAAVALFRVWGRRRQDRTGRPGHLQWWALFLAAAVLAFVFVVAGSPITFSVPRMGHFNVVGGVEILPELAALLLALSIYTAAFIAEVVRAGVLAVAPGQAEAAKSLGLRSGATLRLVVVPQAMRVIIPPLTSQYLNLIKNSSLAVAIGYPDLVQVFAGSVLNLTGQAVEVIAITMAVYLIISLATSLLMNLYGYAIAVEER